MTRSVQVTHSHPEGRGNSQFLLRNGSLRNIEIGLPFPQTFNTIFPKLSEQTQALNNVAMVQTLSQAFLITSVLCKYSVYVVANTVRECGESVKDRDHRLDAKLTEGVDVLQPTSYLEPFNIKDPVLHVKDFILFNSNNSSFPLLLCNVIISRSIITLDDYTEPSSVSDLTVSIGEDE